MARPKSSGPTDHEIAILKVLWQEAPLSVADIIARFPKEPKPAYSSMLTIVRLMDKKGYIKHEKVGKAYYYSPLLEEEKFSRGEIKKLADIAFGGSQYDLAVNIIKQEKLHPEEIQELKALLEGL
ncbi:MAG: BlaI/MecI/CopY family transcriptional regulator [Bdellovibrionales bacterium]|nr:BlaI/MecI/CopY family transcriptional regulator [Bdellovibrionales bacterium]NQZ19212.1 BlaI/MecI/CopY family transcriptional regulator [Bdellovibrionales bacterium]